MKFVFEMDMGDKPFTVAEMMQMFKEIAFSLARNGNCDLNNKDWGSEGDGFFMQEFATRITHDENVIGARMKTVDEPFNHTRCISDEDISAIHNANFEKVLQ